MDCACTMGYYVVQFFNLSENQHKIVPESWIKDAKNHVEKFINESLNHNQVFRCFYTTNPDAFDNNGGPKSDYQPDFSLEIRDTMGEGCFFGVLKKFKGMISLLFKPNLNC